LVKIAALTLSGMNVDAFMREVADWIDKARGPRWKRAYVDLTYLPQIEQFLRSAGYRTYVVSGGG
jgi:hypothetical protein